MWYPCMLEMCINTCQWYFVGQTWTFRYCVRNHGGSFLNVLCQLIRLFLVLSYRLNNNKWHTGNKWLRAFEYYKNENAMFTVLPSSWNVCPWKKLISNIFALTKQGALFSNRDSNPNLLSQFVFHPQISHYIIIPLFKQMLKDILIGQ